MNRQDFAVLIVGAGPAGLAAAGAAAAGGAPVGLVDDNPAPGGQIWRGGTIPAARAWIARVQTPNVRRIQRTRVIAPLGAGALLAETPTGVVELRYDRLILAPGARERFLPFPGWTLPGVMGAGGLQALVRGGLPIAGRRVVVAGSGPLLLAVAAHLREHGARIRLIAEQAPWPSLAAFARDLLREPGKLAQAGALGRHLGGIPLRASCWVQQAHGPDRLAAVTLRQGARTWTVGCDYLACGFGLVPNVELPAAFGCALAGDAVQVDHWQCTSQSAIYCAGEATGIGGVDAALVAGQIAGYAATGQAVAVGPGSALAAARARAARFAAALARHFALRPELRMLATADTLVCRCEDVPYGQLAGHSDWRNAKLQTRCGMGPCQGRVCGAATAFLFGWTPDSMRPPVAPARLDSLIYPKEEVLR